ncbi:MAG TPA: hypothetical protein VFG20_23005 [Planctomycetaceae bacterium]|nr:hypothetical protein [Planctomycetaceae bacterium]
MLTLWSRMLKRLATQRPLAAHKRRRGGRQDQAADVALSFGQRQRSRSSGFSSLDHQLEARSLLAATLTGLANGNVVYGGTGVSNNLIISFDSNTSTYTFSDSGETITLSGTVSGGTGSGTGTITFDATTLPAFNNLIINTGGGNDTITINGFRDGFEGLQVANNAGDGTDTLNINDSIGTAVNRVATAGVSLASETINLGADIFTNNLAVTVGASGATLPINLTNDVTINSGSGTTVINTGAGANGLNGARNLTLSGGAVQLRGDLGTGTPLTSLTATATNVAGAVQVGTAGAKTSIGTTGTVALTAGTGGVSFNSDAVTAGGNVTVTSANSTVSGQTVVVTGQNVSFSGGISGTQGATLNANNGGVTVGTNIALTGVGALTATATTAIDLNGTTAAAGGITLTAPTITAASGLQSTGGAVTVQGNITFDGVGNVVNSANTAAAILFTGTITGNAGNLQFRDANTVTLNGAVTNVNQFTISKVIAGTIADAIVNNVTAQNIAITATTIRTRGDLTATTQSIGLTGAVVLDGTDPTITLTTGLGAGDNLTITGTVNDAGAASNLELIAADETSTANDGNVTVTGAIGGTAAIQSLVVNGAAVNLQAVDVTAGDIRLGGGTLTLAGDLNGTGLNNSVIFAPNGTGGTLEIYNQAVAPASTNMTVDTNDLSRLTATIENMVFGSNSTATVTFFASIPAVFNLPRNTEFRGSTVNLNETLNQGAFSVTLFTDTLNITKALTGTGAVSLNNLLVGGNLQVNGNFAQGGWGASAVTVNNVGGSVTMGGHFGADNIASITVNALALTTTAQPSAIEANGDVTLNVGTLTENGGVFSMTGNVLITGNVVSTSGPLTFLIPAGRNLDINGTVSAVGNITIRARGGAINAVTLSDTVTTSGSFLIDSSGANTALLVDLNTVSAGAILVRGNQVNLANNLTATAGSVHLFGGVNLVDNVILTSSGLANHFVRVDGTVNGAFDLTSQSGLGATHLVGVVGGVNALANLTVDSGGPDNYVYQNMTVTGTVDWKVGDTANNGQDRLTVQSGRTVTAGTAIILEADSVIVNQLTQLFAPSVTVINNGNP